MRRPIEWIKRQRLDRAMLRSLWREHLPALLLYALLSVAISWPTAQHFTTSITSDGGDAKHELSQLWHTQQVLLGRQPLYEAPLLYYPRGATLLTHATGPLVGLFALPWWPLGREAAYNGTLLTSLCLTGYCMYLLARGLGFDRGVSLFAGLVLLASPICLSGLYGHLTKVFLGAMPLALLALHRALDPGRSRWWALAAGLAALLTLMHNGFQFVFLALAMAFFALAALLAAGREGRAELLRRVALAAACSLALAAPILIPTLAAARDPELAVTLNLESFNSPDLLLYILPAHFSRFWGAITERLAQPFQPDILTSLENGVALAWAGLLLCLLGLLRGGRPARRWLLFTLLCVLLSLGPILRVRGVSKFTDYNVPIVLPYAFLTSLPGLEFMRAPGRFMMIGFVGFAVAASFGLAWLTARFPRWRHLVVTLAALLVLIECWPRPFPQETIPPTPAFYRQIASDPEQYGVFDLPFKPGQGYTYGLSYIQNSSLYQVFQIDHHKGIAGGYLSRTYVKHPLFPDVMSNFSPNVLRDGRPAVYANFKHDLVRYGYRYVVWHKARYLYPPERAAEADATSQEFVHEVFGQQAPLMEDERTVVYRVEPDADATVFRLGNNWRFAKEEWRWATSPATLTIVSPRAQPALLALQPALIHDPNGQGGLGAQGVLHIEGGSAAADVPITVGMTATVPLVLVQGSQTLTLTLQAGNFRPSDYGQRDTSVLSFAIQAIDLQTAETLAADRYRAAGPPLRLMEQLQDDGPTAESAEGAQTATRSNIFDTFAIFASFAVRK